VFSVIAEQRLREGKPAEALERLQAEVRARPGDARLRIFLFQLLAIMGDWERALKQLQVATQLDASATGMAQAYREVLRCEVYRAEIFAGRREPVVLGAPQAWTAMLVEALRLDAAGSAEAADVLRGEALARAQANPGVLNGTPFAWLADGDSRLGPILELYLCGRYHWIPLASVACLEFEPPSDLRDLVWAPAKITLEGSEALPCFVPTRYPGTHSGAGDLCLARSTQWREQGTHTVVGIGQRVLFSEQGECALLDLRSLSFEHSTTGSTADA
jgi:type VI secretion system protein ImpE